MNKIKKYLKNGLLDVRNMLIIWVTLSYFAFILYPIIFITVVITYTISAIVELNWRELKKIFNKTNEVFSKIIETLD